MYRFLRKEGIHCDSIAPSLIPVKAETRVKTDRPDAAKLAEYYAKGLLTSIHVPDETDEEVRDSMRSRHFFADIPTSPSASFAKNQFFK